MVAGLSIAAELEALKMVLRDIAPEADDKVNLVASDSAYEAFLSDVRKYANNILAHCDAAEAAGKVG